MSLAHGVAAEHGTHALMTLGPMLMIAVAATLADVRRRMERPALPVAMGVVAGLSMVAGVIHVAASPAHFEESLLYGTFFVVCATAQLGWAALAVLRPSRWLLGAGAAGNVLIAGLWLWTRTAGIPLGPERGAVEPVGVIDLLATATELGVTAVCVALLMRGWRTVVAPHAATA